jgi:hypothetical protein
MAHDLSKLLESDYGEFHLSRHKAVEIEGRDIAANREDQYFLLNPQG